MTSQFFANIYLNALDHYIKEKLACRYYIRYMDDFVVFHHDKRFLWDVKKAIVGYLKGLQLSLHEGKCRIFKTEKGIPFLGLVIFPNRRRLKRENIVRFKRRIKRLRKWYEDGHVGLPHIRQSIRSWIGHAAHANTMQLRRLIFEEVVFRQQRGVDQTWRFLDQQQSEELTGGLPEQQSSR